jgi:hypothetical protein
VWPRRSAASIRSPSAAGTRNCAGSKSPTVKSSTGAPASRIARTSPAILRISEPTSWPASCDSRFAGAAAVARGGVVGEAGACIVEARGRKPRVRRAPAGAPRKVGPRRPRVNLGPGPVRHSAPPGRDGSGARASAHGGEGEGEGAPLPHHALRHEVAAHAPREVAADREARAPPPAGSRACGAGPPARTARRRRRACPGGSRGPCRRRARAPVARPRPPRRGAPRRRGRRGRGRADMGGAGRSFARPRAPSSGVADRRSGQQLATRRHAAGAPSAASADPSSHTPRPRPTACRPPPRPPPRPATIARRRDERRRAHPGPGERRLRADGP